MAWDEMSATGDYSYKSDYDYGSYSGTSYQAASSSASQVNSTAASGAGIAGAALAAGPAGVAIAAGAAAFQVYSGIKQAEAIRRQADLTSKLNELNAQYTEYDAWKAEAYGDTEAARYESTIDKTIGAQRVQYAAQGVDVNYGTAAQVQGETRLTGILNQIDMQNQAYQKAQGLRRQAANIRAGSTAAMEQANSNANAAQISGVAGAIQTGLSAYARK